MDKYVMRDDSAHGSDGDSSLLAELLERTSRTFALAIPCLPWPARQQVTVAYLLFRIADTIEDGLHLDQAEKLAAFDCFERMLSLPKAANLDMAALELPRPPTDNVNYLALMEQVPVVINALARFEPEVRLAIVGSTRTAMRGMKKFVASGTTRGEIRIKSIVELREYCYFVAGVVGEMLTAVFLHGASWLHEVRRELDANARWFGEGLQLVNILKDCHDDERDGRTFIPPTVANSQLFALARQDLCKAEAYVDALKRAEAPQGFIAFTELPLRLALRTLECVEEFGPGSKVPRSEVMSILASTLSPNSPCKTPAA